MYECTNGQQNQLLVMFDFNRTVFRDDITEYMLGSDDTRDALRFDVGGQRYYRLTNLHLKITGKVGYEPPPVWRHYHC